MNIMFTESKKINVRNICNLSSFPKKMRIELSKGYDFFENQSRKLEDLMIITVKEEYR